MVRPVHWIKNLLVFAAVLFAPDFRPTMIPPAVVAFMCFCLLSSFAYVVNDIRDVEQDRLHPRKRLRPLPSGAISERTAWGVAAVLFAAGLGLSAIISPLLGAVALSYVVLNLAYSWYLKHRVIVDVMCIAAGFVLRALAGVVAIEVPLSPWLLVCTFTLCLFIGFGKRRCELAVAGDNHELARDRRPVLARYSLELLTHLLTISAAIAVITFLLYTMDPQTARKFGTNYLIYTVPLVIYGVFRLVVLIQSGRFDGPIELLLNDWAIQSCIGLWLVMAVVIVHWGKDIHDLLVRFARLY